jgi:hypothetical protein
VTCVDLSTGTMVTRTEWLSQAATGTAVPAVDPRVLAAAAERSIHLPAPNLHFNPSGSAVVNLATWLWVDPASWQPQSVSASAGGVTSTAVATPHSVSWSMGDGSTVVCAGPGTVYDLSLPPASQQTSCSYVYAQSSAAQPSPDGDPNDGSFEVTATVDWSVTWSAVGAPGGGVLPDLTTSATVPLRVEQVESLNAAGSGTGGAGDGSGAAG